MKVLLKCHFPSFYMLLFFLRIHSLNILVNEGILENPCVLLGSKLFCSKFDQKSTPPLTEIFLVLCLFAEAGLEIATDTVAFATQFFLFATRKTRVVANLRLGFALTDTK